MVPKLVAVAHVLVVRIHAMMALPALLTLAMNLPVPVAMCLMMHFVTMVFSVMELRFVMLILVACQVQLHARVQRSVTRILTAASRVVDTKHHVPLALSAAVAHAALTVDALNHR